MTEELQFQTTLGRLLSDPHAIRSFFSNGSLPNDLDILPAVRTSLESFLMNSKERVLLVANLLDERLLRKVRPFLPLTDRAVDEHSLISAWHAFRWDNQDEPSNQFRRWACEFAEFSLGYGLRPASAEVTYLNDILRYEYSLLRVHEEPIVDSLQGSPFLNASDATISPDLHQSGYPTTFARARIETFSVPITRLVRALRSGDLNANADILSTAQPQAHEERLLFYVSWIDGMSRAIRLTSSIDSIISLCDGNNPMPKIQHAARNVTFVAPDFPALLESFEHIGLIRVFPEPLRDTIEKTATEQTIC